MTASAPTFSTISPGLENPYHVDASLVETAATLGPIIREYAGVAELNGRLARPVLDAMKAAGMYRLFTPRSLGGREIDPVTFCRVAETIAGFDSAAAWSLQAGNTGSWWASRFSEEGIAELFADGPDLLMAASFSPPHRAEEVAGGYQLTGRGPLASTVHDCSWVMMTGMVFDGEAPRMTSAGPEIVALTMRTSEIEIVDTWRSLGMRGTDSNDVSANSVFVPRSRAFHVTPEFERGRDFRGPLYRLPALVSVSAVIAPVALAIARGAITEVRELADRRTPLGAMKTMRHRSAVQATLAEAEALVRSARLLFFDTIASAWRRAVEGEPFTLEHKADLMLAGAHAVKTASRVADDMHRLGGSSGVYVRSRLERHFRDAQTVRHHGFLCESRLETVGQVYLGVEPDFPMVAF